MTVCTPVKSHVNQGLLNFSHDCRFAVGKYNAHSTMLCSHLIISFYLQFYFLVVLQLPSRLCSCGINHK